jgi:hypothetical protein
VDPTTRAGDVDPPTIMLHLALGAAAVAWRAGAPLRSASIAAVRGVGAAVSTVAPGGVTALVCRGRSARATLERLADVGLRLAVRRVVAALLSTVDLTELVRAHVDLDTVAAGLDVDAVVARVDLDAAVARVDLDAAVARVDLDAAVARVDLDAAVARVDLDAIARRLDLDDLATGLDLDRVVARVDLDEVAARLDLDRVVARVDLDAIIARIDLEGLARQVIDAVDLPEIVRQSTGSLTSETVRSVRTEAMVSPRRRSVQDVMLLSVVVYDWRDDAGLQKVPGLAESPVTDGGRELASGQCSRVADGVTDSVADNGRNPR